MCYQPYGRAGLLVAVETGRDDDGASGGRGRHVRRGQQGVRASALDDADALAAESVSSPQMTTVTIFFTRRCIGKNARRQEADLRP